MLNQMNEIEIIELRTQVANILINVSLVSKTSGYSHCVRDLAETLGVDFHQLHKFAKESGILVGSGFQAKIKMGELQQICRNFDSSVIQAVEDLLFSVACLQSRGEHEQARQLLAYDWSQHDD